MCMFLPNVQVVVALLDQFPQVAASLQILTNNPSVHPIQWRNVENRSDFPSKYHSPQRCECSVDLNIMTLHINDVEV